MFTPTHSSLPLEPALHCGTTHDLLRLHRDKIASNDLKK
jgi:hypothetical protein